MILEGRAERTHLPLARAGIEKLAREKEAAHLFPPRYLQVEPWDMTPERDTLSKFRVSSSFPSPPPCPIHMFIYSTNVC